MEKTLIPLFALAAMLLVACKKENRPVVLETTIIESVTGSTAIVSGEIIDDGGSEITERGFCYSTESNPTIADDKVVDPETGIGLYSCQMTGLSTNTTYYVRAYAVNRAGAQYGEELRFTTSNYPDYIEGGVFLGAGIPLKQNVAGHEKTVIWAPVNLGYSEVYIFGKYFQWGRKQGQGFAGRDGKDEAGVEVKLVQTPNANTSVLSNPDPGTFYTCGNWDVTNTIYDWYTNSKSLQFECDWNDIPETDYVGNPCPEGWRVPTKEEMEGAMEFRKEVNVNYQFYYIFRGNNPDLPDNLSVVLPSAGFRIWHGGFTGRKATASYWTSTIENENAYMMNFERNGGGFGFGPFGRAYANSVRCVSKKEINIVEK